MAASDKPDDGAAASVALARLDPAPELRLAKSLEEAGRGTFVHIDASGQVRSPARYRAMTGLAYGLSATVVVAATLFYMSAFGPLGALVGMVFGGAYWIGLSRG